MPTTNRLIYTFSRSSLFKLTDYLIDRILSLLHSDDARRVSMTCKTLRAHAFCRAHEEVCIREELKLHPFCLYMLAEPGRPQLLSAFTLDTGYSGLDYTAVSLLSDLLAQTRNLKHLSLCYSQQLIHLCPRLGQVIAELTNLVDLNLRTGGCLTIGIFPLMCSRPRYVHHGSDGASDSEDEADYGPLFRSPALGNVECLSLQGFRAEYLRPRVEDSMVPSRLHTWDPIPSVRHLELEECNVPFPRFARILPNLRTITLDDVLDMWQDNGTLGETWPSLDRITVQSACDSVTQSEWWKVGCPVHYVDLRCSESGGPIDEDDGGIEAVTEGIRDTKPVALAVQLKACVDRYFWDMLARPPFTLKCLEINLHMSGEQLVLWLATVVPILANLELMLLQVHIHSPLDGSATPSVDMHQLGGLPEPEVDFELFRAVCQFIPAVIAKSITSLRYLSIVTEEGSRVDGMHGWWRTTWEDGGRQIEVIPAVQGEAIIAHVRSTPGAEQTIFG